MSAYTAPHKQDSGVCSGCSDPDVKILKHHRFLGAVLISPPFFSLVCSRYISPGAPAEVPSTANFLPTRGQVSSEYACSLFLRPPKLNPDCKCEVRAAQPPPLPPSITTKKILRSHMKRKNVQQTEYPFLTSYIQTIHSNIQSPPNNHFSTC